MFDSKREPQTIEGNWTPRPITNESRYVQYVGLDAVTIRNSDLKPFFFLFLDIDSKNQEELRKAVNLCRESRLTIYFYETCKGWHIISPCLLGIRNWMGILKRAKRLQDSSGDTIRWTPRFCDGKALHYHSFNTKKKFFEESYDLHYYLHQKFQCDMTKEKISNVVSTRLQWNVYNQLRLSLKSHY